MSYQLGAAAINLAMPERIPRTEYSAHSYHWSLIDRVTGIRVGQESSPEEKQAAAAAFVREWDYDIFQGAFISRREFGDIQTNMGHAIYAEGGSDFDDEIRCPFETTEDFYLFDPWETYGEKNKREIIGRLNTEFRCRCRLYPESVNITGIYITPVTGLTLIFGWEHFLTAVGEDPQRAGETVNRYASWIAQYYQALAESDIPVVLSHDDIVWTRGAIFDPGWYRTYVFPNLEKLWDPLKSTGKKILFVSDGNYTGFSDDIAACGDYGFWFEVFTDLEYMTTKFGRSHFLIGNGDCRVLLGGSKEAIHAEVERCLSAGRDCPGYIMAVTNHILPNIPVENALYYNQIFQELRYRN